VCSHSLYFESDASCHSWCQRIYVFVHCDERKKKSRNCFSNRSQIAEDVILSFLYNQYHKCKNSGNMLPICDARGSNILSISCHFKMKLLLLCHRNLLLTVNSVWNHEVSHPKRVRKIWFIIWIRHDFSIILKCWSFILYLFSFCAPDWNTLLTEWQWLQNSARQNKGGCRNTPVDIPNSLSSVPSYCCGAAWFGRGNCDGRNQDQWVWAGSRLPAVCKQSCYCLSC